MGKALATCVLAVTAFAGAGLAQVDAGASTARGVTDSQEQYDAVPMPPGFKVVVSELEGPVFADSRGRTLYRWPTHNLRNGPAGDQKGTSTCDDTRYTQTAGLMSPYPPGLELPELDKRPTCVQVWPPALASADAKPIGKWTVIQRKDGRNQWAWDGFPLYTSVLDHREGDVNGGTARRHRGDGPALREPVGPPPLVPPQFKVSLQATGRLLVTSTGYAVYAQDDSGKTSREKCDEECARKWVPVIAPALARATATFSIIERTPGVRQWVFRGEPLFTRVRDERAASFEGSDTPGWHNVYTQKVLPPPSGFTVRETPGGLVLADAVGKTVYIYNCGDDAFDQLACDHPQSPQQYRFAVCGGGDPAVCLKTFPYVLATPGARSASRLWSVKTIDPRTGHLTTQGQPGALNVWAYRERPVFTCAFDEVPGETRADGWGEFNGLRNGFKAFWLRDDFEDNAS